MSFELDFLKLRRPVLNYVSPPVCEIIFSSTGVVIILDPINPLGAPTGLELGGEGGNKLVWDVFPGAICYNVYQSVNADDPFGPYVLVSECDPDPEIPVTPGRCYRVSAITLDGESTLSEPFCVPVVIPPSVVTNPATDIQTTSAIINGTANPNGQATSVYFQWGIDLSYGSQTTPSPIGAGLASIPFDDLLSGLTTNTTYHFRAVASSVGGTVFGADEQFTTPGGGEDPVVDWVISDSFAGAAGTGIDNACGGIRNILTSGGVPHEPIPPGSSFTNSGLIFEIEVFNPNNVENVFPCQGPCGVAGTSSGFISTLSIGPFAQDRVLTALYEGEIQGAAHFSRNGGGEPFCVNLPEDGDGIVFGQIVVTGIGLVANFDDTVINGSKSYSHSIQYTLLAGDVAFVNGGCLADGAGTTSSVKITITAPIP